MIQVGKRAALAGDVDQIGQASLQQEPVRARRLEHSVRRDGRAVEDVPDVPDVDAGIRTDALNAGENALRRIGRSGGGLDAKPAASVAVSTQRTTRTAVERAAVFVSAGPGRAA